MQKGTHTVQTHSVSILVLTDFVSAKRKQKILPVSSGLERDLVCFSLQNSLLYYIENVGDIKSLTFIFIVRMFFTSG